MGVGFTIQSGYPATHHERFLSLMDVTPQALADSGFCSIQLSRSAPDKKPLLRIHEGMVCLNSASVAAMVARVASLGYCSNGGELQERFARTCCHSCRDFGRIFGQAFKSLPCVVVERVSGRGRARGQSKAERHDQERGDEPVRRRQAVGGSFHRTLYGQYSSGTLVTTSLAISDKECEDKLYRDARCERSCNPFDGIAP